MHHTRRQTAGCGKAPAVPGNRLLRLTSLPYRHTDPADGPQALWQGWTASAPPSASGIWSCGWKTWGYSALSDSGKALSLKNGVPSANTASGSRCCRYLPPCLAGAIHRYPGASLAPKNLGLNTGCHLSHRIRPLPSFWQSQNLSAKPCRCRPLVRLSEKYSHPGYPNEDNLRSVPPVRHTRAAQ